MFPVPQTPFSSPKYSFDYFLIFISLTSESKPQGHLTEENKNLQEGLYKLNRKKIHSINSIWHKEHKRVRKGCFYAVKQILTLIERCVTMEHKQLGFALLFTVIT